MFTDVSPASVVRCDGLAGTGRISVADPLFESVEFLGLDVVRTVGAERVAQHGDHGVGRGGDAVDRLATWPLTIGPDLAAGRCGLDRAPEALVSATGGRVNHILGAQASACRGNSDSLRQQAEACAPRRVSQRLPLLVLLAGIVGISVGTVLVRWSETGPVATGVWRLALSLPVLAWFARHQRLERPGLAMAAGGFFAFDLGFYNVALLLTTLANAALLSNLAPALVTVAAVALGLARGGWRTWMALGVALLGALALTQGHGGGGHTLGDLCALASAVGYAGYQLAAQRLRRDTPTAVAMLGSSITGVVLLAPVAYLLQEPMLPQTSQGWLILAGIAITGQLLGQVLIVWALAHLSPAFSSLALLGQPTLVGLMAIPLFGEVLGPLQLIGGVVLLCGVIWAHRIHSQRH